jgi:hypothetical protein
MLKETVLRILQDAAEIDAIQHAIIPTAVTREQLHWEADSDDRAVRNAIHDLRRDGYKIISSTDRAGYWLGGTDEWNAWCDKQRSAALARMYPKTTEYRKQIVISVEAVS